MKVKRRKTRLLRTVILGWTHLSGLEEQEEIGIVE